MTTTLIHLSDIHFQEDWAENQGIVMRALLHDIEQQLQKLDSSERYLVISGDVVRAGESAAQYKEFLKRFDKELDQLGITSTSRICVPGNHDVSRQSIKANEVPHSAVIQQKLNEKSFNDFCRTPKNLLCQKFDNYLKFEKKFAKMGATTNAIVLFQLESE